MRICLHMAIFCLTFENQNTYIIHYPNYTTYGKTDRYFFPME